MVLLNVSRHLIYSHSLLHFELKTYTYLKSILKMNMTKLALFAGLLNIAFLNVNFAYKRGVTGTSFSLQWHEPHLASTTACSALKKPPRNRLCDVSQ